VIQRYAAVLSADGRPEQGRIVYDRICATCHRLAGSGHSVGPDLATVTNRSREALLAAILDPNRAVEEVYYNYIVQTEDGQQFSGIITAETGNSITLTAAESKQHTILRRDIAMLHGTGKSLMPEDMERDLTPDDVNHLIAYLRTHRPPPKQFAGNQPQLAPIRDDGSIRLFAIHAQIYGPSLVFEPGYRNLGFWSQASDHAIWQVDLPQAGQYQVTLDYACADACAGTRFVLSMGEQQLSGEVAGTGTWDSYRSAKVGRLRLPAGRSEILFRSDGPIRSYLMDLRTIILWPVDR
jgi:putative heme-binding domain-containing protein